MAARWWMTSTLVDQTKDAPLGGRPATWSERRVTRALGTPDTNGALARLNLEEQSKNADHVYLPNLRTTHTCWFVMNTQKWSMLRRPQKTRSPITFPIWHRILWCNGQGSWC